MLNTSHNTAVAVGFAVALVFSMPASAKAPVACENLVYEFKAKDVVLDSSTLVPETASDPEHCDVIGWIRGNINFEVFLPTD